MSNRIATGIFTSRDEAAGAVDALMDAGFELGEIGMMVTEGGRKLHLVAEPGTMAAEGAAAVGGLGAVAGGLVAVASLAVPGGLLVAGPVAAVLGGAGAGALTGGLVGALGGLGMPDADARVVADNIERGNIVIAVTADGPRAELARKILRARGADASQLRKVTGQQVAAT